MKEDNEYLSKSKKVSLVIEDTKIFIFNNDVFTNTIICTTPPTFLSISPDEKYIFSAHTDFVSIWNIQTLVQEHSINKDKYIKLSRNIITFGFINTYETESYYIQDTVWNFNNDEDNLSFSDEKDEFTHVEKWKKVNSEITVQDLEKIIEPPVYYCLYTKKCIKQTIIDEYTKKCIKQEHENDMNKLLIVGPRVTNIKLYQYDPYACSDKPYSMNNLGNKINYGKFSDDSKSITFGCLDKKFSIYSVIYVKSNSVLQHIQTLDGSWSNILPHGYMKEIKELLNKEKNFKKLPLEITDIIYEFICSI